MATEQETEDLEALGLIAHSYDSLFSIRKRVRSINDLQIPTRNGLAANQIGMGLLVFIIQIITYGLFAVPIMGFLGISPAWWFLVAWLLGPTILVGQRVAKPMAYNKTIGDAFSSWLRFFLDDKVHRRGSPLADSKFPKDSPITHYQREYVLFPDHAAEDPAEDDVTDEVTEGRLHQQRADVQGFLDDRIRERKAREARERAERDTDDAEEVFSRRAMTTQVLVPETDDDDDEGR